MGRHGISRRQFIAGVSASAAAVTIVPRRVLGGSRVQAPSDTLKIAAIGIGATFCERRRMKWFLPA